MRAVGRTLVAFVALSGIAVEATQPAPRSSGTIVLLAESEAHTADEELGQALLDPDHNVRLVAARVIAVGAHLELLGKVTSALLREQNPDTGAELVRAALHLGGDRDLALINAQAGRLGRRAQLAKAEWQARVQPSQFLPTIPELVRNPDDGVARLIDMSAAQHPDMRPALFHAWMRSAPERGWGNLLELAYSEPAAIAPAAEILEASLSAPRPSIREETVWFILAAVRGAREIPQKVLDAGLPADRPDASDWETFGRELIARHRTNAPTSDRSALITAAKWPREAARALSGLRVLTKPEQDAVASLTQQVSLSPLADWRVKRAAMRTIDLPAPGVVGATLNAAGCKASGELASAALTYWPDGRPRTIRVGSRGLRRECVKALSALARLSIAETGEPVTDATQVVVIPFHSAFLACSSSSDYAPAVPSRGSQRSLTAPKKTLDVKPYYPEEAQRQRIQGVVVVEAVISRQGCIQGGRVLRSIPYLDEPALWAVTQWLFEPTRLDGVAVPAVMTVTVNFQLR